MLDSAITNGIRLMSFPLRNKRKKLCTMAAGQCSKNTQDAAPCQRASCSNYSEALSSSQSCSTLDYTTTGDHVQRSFNSVLSSLDDMPHYLNVNLRVATAMSQFYSLLRKLKPCRGFDLNASACDETYPSQSALLPAVRIGEGCRR